MESNKNMVMNNEWDEFLLRASNHFKVMANLEFLLFIIGIQELGQGYKQYSKQEKMDLIALAQCKLMSMNGYAKEKGCDAEGWPVYQSITEIEELAPSKKEQLIKKAIIEYFETVLTN